MRKPYTLGPFSCKCEDAMPAATAATLQPQENIHQNKCQYLKNCGSK